MSPGELEIETRELLERLLARGFCDAPGAVLFAVDYLSDGTNPDEVRRTAERLLPGVVERREREVAGWPAATDCDKLDAAFEELNARGILARHDWTCCRNCGVGQAQDEHERLGGRWDGRPLTGYAFYHNQDTDHAVDGGELFLAFGAFGRYWWTWRYKAAARAVAEAVTRALSRHGLKYEWDGDVERRIAVNIDWKRRRPPERFVEVDGVKLVKTSDRHLQLAPAARGLWSRLWPWAG